MGRVSKRKNFKNFRPKQPLLPTPFSFRSDQLGLPPPNFLASSPGEITNPKVSTSTSTTGLTNFLTESTSTNFDNSDDILHKTKTGQFDDLPAENTRQDNDKISHDTSSDPNFKFRRYEGTSTISCDNIPTSSTYFSLARIGLSNPCGGFRCPGRGKMRRSEFTTTENCVE